MVRARYEAESAVMIGPDRTYDEKAEYVSQVRGPLLEERPQKGRSPSGSLPRWDTPISMTSSVIATANTPSLKASILPVSSVLLSGLT